MVACEFLKKNIPIFKMSNKKSEKIKSDDHMYFIELQKT